MASPVGEIAGCRSSPDRVVICLGHITCERAVGSAAAGVADVTASRCDHNANANAPTVTSSAAATTRDAVPLAT
jgi:hypothetical protein